MGEGLSLPLYTKGDYMSRTFKYNGVRKEKHGVKKTFNDKDLTKEKLDRLKSKGWSEIIEKPKPKPKAKKKK